MAESKELTESRMLQEIASCAAEDENLTEKLAEMVLPSARSLAESTNPDSSNPTQVLVGKGNAAFNECIFNITNICGGDNGALQKSSVTEVESSCPLPSKPAHEPEEPLHQAAGAISSSPSPKWTKSKEEMLVRVVPLATEMVEDCDDDLILTIWMCWDDNETFQNIVKSEHQTGNVTLDSYDTIILKKPVQRSSNSDTIAVVVTTIEEYSWRPRQHQKNIQRSGVWNAQRAKCSFRIQKNSEYPESQLMYIKLRIIQSNSFTSAETEFILRKRISDIRMPTKEKGELLQLLETTISASTTAPSNCTPCDENFTCWAIPYLDKMFSLDEDVIVTLWLCWYDEGGKLLEALKSEQKLYARELLDTENSLVLTNSEEDIETELKHNGYSDGLGFDYYKTLKARRIMQGKRAKFQFISKRIEESREYADRISDQIKENDLSEMEKNLISEKRREMHKANNVLPKVKPNKLDVEISTWQGEQDSIEFKKVTEVSQFLCGGMEEACRKQMSLGLKSCIKKTFRHIKRRTETWNHRLRKQFTRGGVPKYAEAQMNWEAQGLVNQAQGSDIPCTVEHGGVTKYPEFVAEGPLDTPAGYDSEEERWHTTYPGGAHVSHLYYGRDALRERLTLDMFIQDSQQHVLRLYIFASHEHDCDNALNLHMVLVTVSSSDAQNKLTQDKMHNWTAIDSYDTFLLTSQVCGCYDPPVKVTFEAHKTSHWLPDSDKMVIDVKEVLKEGIAKCSSRFRAATDSQQNGLFNATVRVTQKVGRNEEEVWFVIKKQMEDIERLTKETCSSKYENPIMPSVEIYEDPEEGVMLDEYQTCLAVSYVDLMQNIDDDIILTVWICSIQQSKNNFSDLCEDQDRYKKIQVDTENSFVFSDMISPVSAEVELNDLWTVAETVKKVDPRRIKEGGRAKFQFVCKQRISNENSNKFDVEITICQNFWNQVQFMTRKRVESFLQNEFRTNIPDTGHT